LIRERKTFGLNTVMQTGKKYGMQTLDTALETLLNDGLISPEDALLRAHDKFRFSRFPKDPPSDVTSV